MHACTPDHILLVELLEQADLTNGCAWHALLLLLQPNLLQRIDLAGIPVTGLVDHAIGALANALKLFILRQPSNNSASVDGNAHVHLSKRVARWCAYLFMAVCRRRWALANAATPHTWTR